MSEPTRQCKLQSGNMMEESWCIQAQQRDICTGCKHNEGREVSRFIEALWGTKQENGENE